MEPTLQLLFRKGPQLYMVCKKVLWYRSLAENSATRFGKISLLRLLFEIPNIVLK
jgi:hypothetical protein